MTKTLAPAPEFFAPNDKEKQHPYVGNLYFAWPDTKTLSHANCLFLGYNCESSELTDSRFRVVCNTIEEIEEALNAPARKWPFKIVTPLGLNDELDRFLN